MNGLLDGFQHVLLKPQNHFALFFSLHPSDELSQTFPILMPSLWQQPVGGRAAG